MAAKKQFEPEQILKVLRLAREKIARRQTWVQSTWVKRIDAVTRARLGGNTLYAYCATGAAGSAAKELGGSKALRAAAVNQLQEALPESYVAEYGSPTIIKPSVEGFNDSQNHRDVVRLFDRSIKRLEKKVTNG